MTNLFVDIILPKTFPLPGNDNILCVTPTHTLHRTRQAWLEKFGKSAARIGMDTEKIKIVFLKGYTRRPLNGFSWELLRLVKKTRPDNVVMNRFDSFNTLAVYILIGILFPKTKMFIYSEAWLQPKVLLYKLAWPVFRWLLQRAETVYVIGSVHRQFMLEQGVSPRRVKIANDVFYAPVIPARQIVSRLLQKYRSQEIIQLLYVGRIIPYKGLLPFLHEVVGLMLGQTIQFHLTIVGGGRKHNFSQYAGREENYEEKCRAFAHNHLTDWCTFVGYQENVDTFLRQADMMIMPNVIIANDIVPAEAWGRVLPEALRCDLPVMATTAVPAAHEYIKNGVNGWMVPKLTAAVLKEALSSPSAK